MAAAPNRMQFLGLALLAALALGCALALGQELSDRSLRSEGEAGDTLALPVLACVPELVGNKYDLRVLPSHVETDA
jgi:capsular polysaccharide biosynthesis protein